MYINEDYFKDLEINDEDIIEDDTLDVEGPYNNLTVEEFHKLPEQYNQVITIRIRAYDVSDIAFIQKTSLITRIYKRLDDIFELYGIDHSLYVLASSSCVEDCDTIVEYGDYQLFCEDEDKENFINDTYDRVILFIHVFVNYPEFTYKRAFRFLYTMLNLYKNSKLINRMSFEPLADDYIIELTIMNSIDHILFCSYNKITTTIGTNIDLYKKLTEEDKRYFYNPVIRHFFGEKVNKIDYKAIDRDVPFKPIIPR